MFTDGRTDGRTTNGRQAHRYIPRTLRPGDKNTTMATFEFVMKILVFTYTCTDRNMAFGESYISRHGVIRGSKRVYLKICN